MTRAAENTLPRCRGSLCVTEIGTTRGTCSAVEPPGSGSSGAGGAGGTGGTGNSGGSAAAGSGGDPGEPSCAVYGQQCEDTSDCCSEVPCSDGYCIYPLL